MAAEKVVPTERQRERSALDLGDPLVVELIHRAQESDAEDRKLTVRQALGKYKKAVFWAMILSTSLIMEGYDLTLVRSLSPTLSPRRGPSPPKLAEALADPVSLRSTPFTARPSSATASACMTPRRTPGR